MLVTLASETAPYQSDVSMGGAVAAVANLNIVCIFGGRLGEGFVRRWVFMSVTKCDSHMAPFLWPPILMVSGSFAL